MKPISVVAVESQPVVVEGLRRIFDASPGFVLAGATGRLDQAMELAGRLRPDVMVVDQALGIRAALLMLADLRRLRIPVALILRVRDFSLPERRMALDSGVRGYLEKTHTPDLLLECLSTVAAGGLWPADWEDALQEPPAINFSRLTRREREILELVRAGLKNREIAGRLSITPSTVKVHLMHLFEKTGSRDRQELAWRAVRLMEQEAG